MVDDGQEIDAGAGRRPPVVIPDPVKLVIWDLDDTLWSGVLSEGDITIDPSVIDLVRTLNRRGIVNSVCSKNDADAVEAVLRDHGLWEEIVFPSVDWLPKGSRVARILDRIQLRPQNVLFIDDLVLNRVEVESAVPGIVTAGPEIIPHLLSHPSLAGKDDRDLSRLRQYRVLEQKHSDFEQSELPYVDFLRSCEIRVGLCDVVDADTARVHELVTRTNQLNFTKRRPTLDECRSMIDDPGRRCGIVRVHDKFGDYGASGFFSFSADGTTLTDFLFSCRILNMGVESWVYDQLGRPDIAVVGEVAGTLDETVDWITRDDDVELVRGADPDGAPGGATAERVLMLGGCDLQPVAQLLRGRIDPHFHRVSDTGAPIHDEHSDILRQAARGLTEEEYSVVDRFGFLDRTSFQPALLEAGFDVLVYSALMDMTQDRYRHRATGLVVPWNQLDVDATDPADWDVICDKFGHVGMTEDVLRGFAQEFERIGAITPAQFQENITWMATTIPEGARMIVINGSEFPLEYPGEPRRHVRHREINRALDEVASTLPNVEVCDVRPFTGSAGDFRLDIRHYRRHVYVRTAEEIQKLCPVLEAEPGPEPRRGLRSLRYALGRRRTRRLRSRAEAARRR